MKKSILSVLSALVISISILNYEFTVSKNYSYSGYVEIITHRNIKEFPKSFSIKVQKDGVYHFEYIENAKEEMLRFSFKGEALERNLKFDFNKFEFRSIIPDAKKNIVLQLESMFNADQLVFDPSFESIENK